MARTFRPFLSLAVVVIAAILLASASVARASTTITYAAELYLDLEPAGVENYGGRDFVGLGSTPSGFVPALDRLFFVASSSNSGTELWSLDADGKAGMVKDIKSNLVGGEVGSGLGSSNFGETTTAVAGGRLFFFADDAEHGVELWSTDGTEENTMMVKDVNYGTYSGIDTALFSTSSIPQIVAFKEYIYFPARYNFDRSAGLYVSDGTEEGTQLVEEGLNSPLPSSTVVSYITKYNGKAYFPADGEVCHSADDMETYCQPGMALWVLEDGLLARQAVNLTAPLVTGNGEKTMFVHKDALYITTTDGLVRTDGTQEGTAILLQNGDHYASMEDALYFTCSDPMGDKYPICKTDGTTERTSIVANMSSSVGLSRGLTPLGDKILFHNRKRKYGVTKPHVLDTVSGKVSILADLETNDIFSGFFVHDNHAFFKAKEIVNVNGTGLELWVTDGTKEGTVLVKDIGPGMLGSDIQGYGIFRDELYFNAHTIETGNELWRVVRCPDGVCPAPATELPTRPPIPTTATTSAVPQETAPLTSPILSTADPGQISITQPTVVTGTLGASPNPTQSPAGNASAAEPLDEENDPTFFPTANPTFSPTVSPVYDPDSLSASSLGDSATASQTLSRRFFVLAILLNLVFQIVAF